MFVRLTDKGRQLFERLEAARSELAQVRIDGQRAMTEIERQQWRAREFNAERTLEEVQAELNPGGDRGRPH